MNIILVLASITLVVASFWLLSLAKSEKQRIRFIHEESNEGWTVFRVNHLTILKAYISKNLIVSLLLLAFLSVLIVLTDYFFYNKLAWGIVLSIILAIGGAIGAGFVLGSNSSTTEVSSGAEKIFKALRETIENIKENFIKGKDESIIYSGYIELPSKIFVDESANILVNLFGEISPTKSSREYLEYTENEKLKLIDIHLQRKQNISEFLKVELQAASLKVGGETSQQINLINNALKFQWSVSSEKPTIHKITLIFSKVSDSLIKTFAEIEHDVKVVNLLGLTRRQVFLCAVVSGLLGLLPVIAKILEALGLTIGR